MKPGDAEYMALVEKKRAEIRGNVESKVMTSAECDSEVKAITGGAVSSFSEQIVMSKDGPNIIVGITATPAQANIPQKKRGRSKGSKNRPKA